MGGEGRTRQVPDSGAVRLQRYGEAPRLSEHRLRQSLQDNYLEGEERDLRGGTKLPHQGQVVRWGEAVAQAVEAISRAEILPQPAEESQLEPQREADRMACRRGQVDFISEPHVAGLVVPLRLQGLRREGGR